MIKRDSSKNETGNKKYITVNRGARLFLYRIHLRRKRMCEAHSSARCIVHVVSGQRMTMHEVVRGRGTRQHG